MEEGAESLTSELEIIIKSWNLKDPVMIMEILSENNIEIDELLHMDDLDAHDIAKDVPIKLRIQFKRELKLWRKNFHDYSAIHGAIPEKKSILIPLDDLLIQTAKGRLLFEAHKNNRSNLTGPEQTKVVHLIAEEFCHRMIKFHEAEFYADEIVRLFPGEEKALYFHVENGKPSGKIYHRVKNQRPKGCDSKTIDLNPTSGIQPDSVLLEPEVNIEDAELIEEKKKWLKNHRTPWCDVIDAWRLSYSRRQQDIIALNTIELLENWPLFKHSHAKSLIALDFQIMHPNKGTNFHTKWESAFPRLLAIYDEEIKDAQCRKFLLQLQEEELSEDMKNCLFILILHGLLKPDQYKQNGKLIKPTIKDSQDSMAVVIDSLSKMKDCIDKARSCAEKSKRTLQPFLIIPKNGQKITVYHDGIALTAENVLGGIELLFQVYHVLNLKYPEQCMKVWSFIQTYFFDMDDNCSIHSKALCKRLML